jgi:hypothetical protein
MPIKRHVLWRANEREVRVCENVKRRRAALLPYAAGCVSWELSDPPPCIYCILSLSLNNMDSLPWM